MAQVNVGSAGREELIQAAGLRPELADAMHRAAEGTAELGRALRELAGPRTRYNLEARTALATAVRRDQATKAVGWDRVLQAQGEYLRVSLERTARLTQRCLGVSQAVVATTPGTAARGQSKKVA